MVETSMSTLRTHASERPAFLGPSWRNSSRGTDQGPHATLWLTPDQSPNAPAIAIWVHRVNQTAQYRIVLHRTGADDVTLWMGNDEGTASTWATGAEIAATIATEITAHPDLLLACSFAELHDYCDANCLGDQEAFLESCGWTG